LIGPRPRGKIRNGHDDRPPRRREQNAVMPIEPPMMREQVGGRIERGYGLADKLPFAVGLKKAIWLRWSALNWKTGIIFGHVASRGRALGADEELTYRRTLPPLVGAGAGVVGVDAGRNGGGGAGRGAAPTDCGFCPPLRI
jgi:hypothetical protein